MRIDVKGLPIKWKNINDVFLPYDLAEHYYKNEKWGTKIYYYDQKYTITVKRKTTQVIEVEFIKHNRGE